MINTKNVEMYQRSLKVMPGAQSNLRMPVGIKPLFMVKAKKAHFWDIDSNEYIDFMIGAGPGIFGHGNKDYLRALKTQLDTLYFNVSGASQSLLEIELAEKFVELVPCAEKVRFCLSGTEAVQLAIRLARAYTKRRYFIRFEGHYHGWLDNVLGGVVNDDRNATPFALESPDDPLGSEGKDPSAIEQSFKIPWNDIEILEQLLVKYGDKVALIIMEPILCNSGCCPPRPGYLEKVRELCTKYGIVLCFDEVITGFRVCLNSAQGLFGVTPDISTFGKAIAGGLPMGAVAGKREILDLLLEKRVIGAGTFNGYPLGMAASLASIKLLQKDNGAYYHKIEMLQNSLMTGIKNISKKRSIPLLVQGPMGVFYYQFIDKEVAYSPRDLRGADIDKQNKMRMLLLEEGVLVMWGGRWYMCSGLTQDDIDVALKCFDRAVNKL